ncbi:hypothetical protein BDB00DRAFT_233355 [Zychaea mexicana]|uniref:uncharacterized protein n=1 Tax=Zychaea mexicana TaxID=64656 RepID=UPI0022FE8633|nr:uncharacterized protein BDB00DRAFT_233355 [Zychaea mexicana]KAI9499414.1 hypothetical protein BDB00DRAFT_233355 [Zychaea mexicana]
MPESLLGCLPLSVITILPFYCSQKSAFSVNLHAHSHSCLCFCLTRCRARPTHKQAPIPSEGTAPHGERHVPLPPKHASLLDHRVYHSFHFLWCCMFCYVIVGNPQVDSQSVIRANENSRGFEVPNEKKCLYKASNFAFLFSLLFSSFWYSFDL